MIKVGVADYGMNCWYGGFFDYAARMDDLQAIGFDGIERLTPHSAEDALTKAALLANKRMSFATCLAPTVELSIKWTAALGKKYIWVDVNAQDFDAYCRQVNDQAAACERYGLTVALHNHLGSPVETQQQLERFLQRCPTAGLVFDTGHLAVAGGDAAAIARQYGHRIAALHIKEWVSTNPTAEHWFDRGYFCELGGGTIPVDNETVVKTLLNGGYDGWIFIEQDTHLKDPLADLAASRKILGSWGV